MSSNGSFFTNALYTFYLERRSKRGAKGGGDSKRSVSINGAMRLSQQKTWMLRLRNVVSGLPRGQGKTENVH